MIRLKNQWKNILENRSMFGILRDFGNHRFAIAYDDSKELFSIGLEKESANKAFDHENKKGGIIVFSTDMNTIQQSENKIIEWGTNKYRTLNNRIFKASILDKIAHNNKDNAITVGNYLQGRYKAKNGSMFTKDSVSVEILGVHDNMLFSLGEELCKDFHQECVLIKSYHDGGVYFVDNKHFACAS